MPNQADDSDEDVYWDPVLEGLEILRERNEDATAQAHAESCHQRDHLRELLEPEDWEQVKGDFPPDPADFADDEDDEREQVDDCDTDDEYDDHGETNEEYQD